MESIPQAFSPSQFKQIEPKLIGTLSEEELGEINEAYFHFVTFKSLKFLDI